MGAAHKNGLARGLALAARRCVVWRLLRRGLRAFAVRARRYSRPVPRAPDLGGVLGPGESPVPALFGLRSQADLNAYFSARLGQMYMVPEGKDSEIKWPKGTSMVQCEAAPQGHWLLMISDFEKMTTVWNADLAKTGVPDDHPMSLARRLKEQ